VTVYAGQSSGTTVELEEYDFADVAGRYVRIVGHGNSESDWNSITEVEIHGRAVTSSAVRADLNSDGSVGQTDLDIILDKWGQNVPLGDPADPSGDGMVGQTDLDIVLSAWSPAEMLAAPLTTQGMLLGSSDGQDGSRGLGSSDSTRDPACGGPDVPANESLRGLDAKEGLGGILDELFHIL